MDVDEKDTAAYNDGSTTRRTFHVCGCCATTPLHLTPLHHSLSLSSIRAHTTSSAPGGSAGAAAQVGTGPHHITGACVPTDEVSCSLQQFLLTLHAAALNAIGARLLCLIVLWPILVPTRAVPVIVTVVKYKLKPLGRDCGDLDAAITGVSLHRKAWYIRPGWWE